MTKIKVIFSVCAVLCVLVMLTALVGIGTNGLRNDGIFQKWFGERYSFKKEMPELTEEELPELAETDSCVLFVSYSGAVVGKIQLVAMLYARDESSAEYRLYVADDYLAEGREVQEYRYIVRSDTAGMPAGQWLRIEDGKATPQYPAEYPLYFEQKGSQAPLTAVAEKIFN